jgi:hypothetical protein
MGRQPLAIIFDMDECTGSWQYGSILYGIFQYLNMANSRIAREIYLRHIFPTSVRPGFVQCLKRLQQAKNSGRIQDVICYTANTGVGYPEFVKDCYEIASQTPGLFSAVYVVHRTGEHGADGAKSLQVLQHRLNPQYKYPYHNVIAFDDRPSAWSNYDGSSKRVVKVSAFKGTPFVNIRNLIFDIVHGIGIQNVDQPYQIAEGKMSFLTTNPNRISTRRLSDLFQDLSNWGGTNTNISDRECLTIMRPSIKEFIHRYRHGKQYVQRKRLRK